MFHYVGLWLGLLTRCLQSQRSLLLENLALRQQLAVLKRKHARLCLSKNPKCLSGRELYFFHSFLPCSFLLRHFSPLCPRSSVRALSSSWRTWLCANSVVKSLVLAKANSKRTVIALLLGFATFALAVSGMSSTARAQDGTPTPFQGTWLNTITRINQGGAIFTAVASFAGGGVWQATGANDRQNGVSPCTAVGSASARIGTARERISLPLIPAATRLSFSESIRFRGSKTRINSKELVKLTSVHYKAKARTT